MFLEIFAFSLAPTVGGLLFGGDPGFLRYYGLPILSIGPLFAAFYGFAWGFAAAAFSALLAFIAAPAAFGMLSAAYASEAASRLTVPAAALTPVFLLLAFGRHRADLFRERMLGRLRAHVRRSAMLQRTAGALERVNRVLENRVSGQKDSITLLHNQVKKLVSLDLEHALEALLETVELFTEASSACIRRVAADGGTLEVAAARSGIAGANRAALDMDGTIEGYVIRNKKPFSARMVLENSEFDRFDTARTIIALPVLIKDKAWGVLSIEDLPFERYSAYTESILSILLGLAEPYLRTILEYESLRNLRELDEDTGYPEYSILHATLEKETERLTTEPGTVSLIVVEMANFDEEVKRHPRADLKRLLFRIKTNLEEIKGRRFPAFHFRGDNQMALIVDGLDRDGASFFCLDLLALCANIEPAAGEEAVPLEIIVGFSTSDGSSADPDAMIEAADQLLVMQRL